MDSLLRATLFFPAVCTLATNPTVVFVTILATRHADTPLPIVMRISFCAAVNALAIDPFVKSLTATGRTLFTVAGPVVKANSNAPAG
jgi:hypothetical protein